jgi:hypothetical protein
LPFYTSTTNTTSNPSRRSVFFIPLPHIDKILKLGYTSQTLKNTHTFSRDSRDDPSKKKPPQMEISSSND